MLVNFDFLLELLELGLGVMTWDTKTYVSIDPGDVFCVTPDQKALDVP